MSPINYETIREKQINQYYQSWWGGPEKLTAFVDPPVKFYET